MKGLRDIIYLELIVNNNVTYLYDKGSKQYVIIFINRIGGFSGLIIE